MLIPPKITKNLQSISKFATDNDVFCLFHHFCCILKDLKTHQVSQEGMKSDGLFKLYFPSSVTEFIIYLVCSDFTSLEPYMLSLIQ